MSSFNAVELAGSADVKITFGNSESVVVEAEDNILPLLGASLVTVGSYSEPAGALYATLGFTSYDISEPWRKEW